MAAGEMRYRRFFKERNLLLLLFALCLYAVVVCRSGWLAEDAFITFRTVDNWINGYGLRWNVSERVQGYTHPLWMFAVALFYRATGEIFYTTIVLSAAISLGAALVLALGPSGSRRAAIVGLLLLTCSKGFVDYSTSGLENPLTHLLLALFLWIYLRRDLDEKGLLWLALLAGLAMVNRMDTALLFLPGVAYGLWRLQSGGALRATAIGFSPFALWELFSLAYYGFFVPNTAYAKLNTGIPGSQLAVQGAYYLLDSLLLDPLTLATVAFGLATPLLKRAWRQVPLALGMLLYLAYVVRIGGDFMSGRFLTPPFFVAVGLIVHNHSFVSSRIWAATLGLVLLTGLLLPRSPLRSRADYGRWIDEPSSAWKISDERALYYRHAGLLPALAKGPGEEYPDHWWALRGRRAREKKPLALDGGGYEGFLLTPAASGNTLVTTWTNVGYSGFYAGPGVHILDALALADPLLARLPAREESGWGPGHYLRIMPAGYIETHISGRNAIADPDLAAYYDALCLITRAPLFAGRRWKAMWKMHTGQYDHLIDFERFRHPSELERCRSDVRIRPLEPRTHFALGVAYFAQGQTEQGIEELEAARRLDPDDFANLCIIGRTYTTYQCHAEANAAYREAIRSSAAHLRRLEEQQDLKGLCDAYRSLAEAHYALDEPERAIAALEKALEIRQDDAQIYIDLGRLFFETQQLEQAARCLERAGELDPERARVHADLGAVLREMGRLAEAEETYRRAARLEPGNPHYRQNLGIVQFQRQKNREALESLQQAIRLGARSVQTYLLVARIHRNLEQPEEELRTYREIIDRDIDGIDSGTFLRIGVELFRRGDVGRSTAAYRRALSADSGNAAARTNLGWNLYLEEDFRAAIDAYRQVLAQQRNSVARFNLGLALLASGDTVAAQDEYARGVREFGPDEAVRIGAVDDLKDLITRGLHATAAQQILATYWPGTR